MLSYSENPESLSLGLGSVPGRDTQTDRHLGGRTDGHNHDSCEVADLYIFCNAFVYFRRCESG